MDLIATSSPPEQPSLEAKAWYSSVMVAVWDGWLSYTIEDLGRFHTGEGQ